MRGKLFCLSDPGAAEFLLYRGRQSAQGFTFPNLHRRLIEHEEAPPLGVKALVTEILKLLAEVDGW